MSRILVVDDDRGIRESLSLILGDQNHVIETAVDGMEAMERLGQRTFDLVLSDILMPRMDGMELLRTIRERWGTLTSVILISAYATEATVTEALDQGARDLIVKPFDVATVREAVDYALTRNSFPPAPAKIQERRQDRNLKQRLLEYSVLEEIGMAFSRDQDLTKLGSRLQTMVQQILKSDRSLLVLYQADQPGFAFRSLFLRGQPAAGEISAGEEYVLEWLQRHRRALYVPDVARDQDFVDTFAGGSILAMPFLRNGRVRGALLLYRGNAAPAFGSETLQFLGVLGSLAASALDHLELTRELQRSFHGSVKALLATLEAKDAFTFNHSQRVARYARRLGQGLKLDEVELHRLEYLALLHDIGKIAVPEDILRQRAKLSDWEQQVLRTHVEVGANIVKPLGFLPDAPALIRAHHEWFDGSGYPDRLRGEAIPLFARLLAVANAFDRLTSDYPGATPQPAGQARESLRRLAGSELDPELVHLFLRLEQLR
ncbi:MAG: HD domain-containing phosphohydrolase [candidate division FCPU426 bacterium]